MIKIGVCRELVISQITPTISKVQSENTLVLFFNLN
jgi:hypothetical protein